jgi:hypothetical protein
MAKKNRLAAAILLITVVLILLIAAGIPNLELQPGQKYVLPTAEDDTYTGGRGRYATGEGILFLMRFLFAVAIIMLPFFLLYTLFTPEGRRRLLALLVIIAFVFVIISNRDEPPSVPEPTPALEGEEAPGFRSEDYTGLYNVAPPPLEEPPDWISYAIITGAALVFATLVVGGIWYYRKRAMEDELSRLGLEMRMAIESIEEGGDLGNTILTAYRDMSRVVRQTQGVERTGATTPHEFISVLTGKGLPLDAVQDITRLFEQVRYGSKLASQADEQRAIASLRAIAAACEERRHAV